MTAPQENGRSPWGKIQHVINKVEGIDFVTTAGHGGFKLNRQRQNQMPKPLRCKNGWYEEDCEAYRVIAGLSSFFKPQEVQEAHRAIKAWYPDTYTAWTGQAVTLEQSHVLRERKFHEEHKNDYIVTAAWGDWAEGVPPGMVGVVASKGEDRSAHAEERWFLVPQEEYSKRGEHGFVIDLGRHLQVDWKFGPAKATA